METRLVTSYQGSIQSIVSLNIVDPRGEIVTQVHDELVCHGLPACRINLVYIKDAIHSYHSITKSQWWIEAESQSKMKFTDLKKHYETWEQEKLAKFVGYQPISESLEQDLLLFEFTFADRSRNIASDKLNESSDTTFQELFDLAIDSHFQPSTEEISNFSENAKLETRSLLKRLSKVQRDFNQVLTSIARSSDAFSEAECPPVFAHVGRYCSASACEDEMRPGEFAQDLFYGIEPTVKENETFELGLKELRRKVSVSGLSKLVSCQCPTISSVKPVPLAIDGGDMLIAEKFVLLGKNNLVTMFLDTAKTDVQARLDNLEIEWRKVPQCQLEKNVNKALADNFFGSEKKIVWVGLDDVRPIYDYDRNTKKLGGNLSFSPFYHIDLFLTILGENYKMNGRFQILVGVPHLKYQTQNDVCTRTMIRSLKWHVLRTAITLKNDVFRKTGVEVELITVPLPLVRKDENRCFIDEEQSERYWLRDCYSFSNGIVEKTSEGVRYFMPIHHSPSDQVYFDIAFQQTMAKLTHNKINVIPIKAAYKEMRSSLRCITKVVAREVN